MMDDRQKKGSTLEFKVFSGGTITIDLERCGGCVSKACIQVCQVQGGPLQLDLQYGIPGLGFSPVEIEKGKCNECLGCELECDLSGRQALHINLPVAGFAEYLETLILHTIYQR